MQIYDAADVTGDGSRHTLASVFGFAAGATARAKFILVQAVSVSSTSARVGSASISTTRGQPVNNGGAQFEPPIAQGVDFYDLQNIYYLAANGDTLAISYGI